MHGGRAREHPFKRAGSSLVATCAGCVQALRGAGRMPTLPLSQIRIGSCPGGRRDRLSAFAIACARAGASAVTAVEISDSLVKQIDENAQLNGVTITTKEANVFDYLSDQIRDNIQFDLIVLDPPSFTKSKESLNNARRGYKEIHLRALQLLPPEGYLATFSCSHHVSRAMFLEMIVDASMDAKRHVRILKSLSQPLDHPILPHIPETEYLKGYLLQVLPGR